MGVRDRIAKAVMGIKAYHSSPHDFDRFDLSKIGTGEGAQVYGHGIYAAENPAVSGQGGQYWQQFTDRFKGAERIATDRLHKVDFDREQAAALVKRDIEQARQFLKEGFSSMPAGDARVAKALAENEQALKMLESGAPVGPRTYELNIKADPAQMLDWDKPLREQPQIWEGLHNAGHGIPKRLVTPDDIANLQTKYGDWGKLQAAAVKDLPEKMGSEFRPFNYEMSQRMNEAGIPGIKYLDQGSRSSGYINGLVSQYGSRENALAMAQEKLASTQDTFMRDTWQKAIDQLQRKDTSNYVIFDPSIIDITKKYGIPGAIATPVMGAIGNQSQYEEAQ